MDTLVLFAILQILFVVGIIFISFYIIERIIFKKVLREKISTISTIRSMHPKLFEKEMVNGRFFPYGMCVISRSNEKDPLQKGIVVGYAFHQSSSPVPLVRYFNQKTGILDIQPFMCFSILIPYSDMMWDLLKHMTHKQQYEYLSEIVNGSLSIPAKKR